MLFAEYLIDVIEQSQKHEGNYVAFSALIPFEKRRPFQICKRQRDLKFHLVLLALRVSLPVPE